MTSQDIRRFGDVFAPCDVLLPAARRRLAAVLVVPSGHAPPLLPTDLAVAGLPCGHADRSALRGMVEDGLGPGAMAALDGVRLRDVVPAIADRPWPVDLPHGLGRLARVLEQEHAATWGALGEVTVGAISGWRGVGPTLTRAIVGLAVEAGLAAIPDGAESRQAEPATAAADVGVLLRHDARAGGGQLRTALERCADPEQPAPVRAAAVRLLAGQGQVPHRWLPLLDRVLAAAGDERDQAVFVHTSLRLEDRPSLPSLAAALGLSAERVRQLRCRARDRVAAAWERCPDDAHQFADSVARRVGAAAPLDGAGQVLAGEGLPPLPDTRSLLVLWVAGAFRPIRGHPGWVARDPVELVAQTRRALADDGGVRPAEQVREELHHLGMLPQHVGPWLARQPVHSVDGMLVLTAGAPAAVAERVLFAAGQALTAGRLAAAVGRSAEALLPALRADQRFVQVGPETFELAEWERAAQRVMSADADDGLCVVDAVPDRVPAGV